MYRLLLTLIVSTQLTSGEPGSCAKASRCCSGRDSSCIVNGLQAYGAFVDSPCYCDEGCLETGDCCDDYKNVCSAQVIDCQLSSWSIWSSCSASCGSGVQTRDRLITTHPSPRGKACEPLEQKRPCVGNRCSRQYWKYKNPIRETAGLLPAKFWKRYSGDSWDVRENLFRHQSIINKNQQSNEINNHIEGFQADQPTGNRDYCIVFELSRVTKACQTDKDFEKMAQGHQMCALCPADARRENLGNRCKGHGVDSKLTRWRSTVKPQCHGKWRRIYEMDKCPCSGGPDYIFV